MNPTALVNFFNNRIIQTAAGRIRSIEELNISGDTLSFIRKLPDNVDFLVFNSDYDDTSVLKQPAGVVSSDDPRSGFIRIDLPIKGSSLVAKIVVPWRVSETLFRYGVYFGTPSSDGCLRVPVSGATLGIAVSHAQEVWDRLVTGGFVMKSERPTSHVS